MTKTTKDYGFVAKIYGEDLVTAANMEMKTVCYSFVTRVHNYHQLATFWEYLVEDSDARYSIWAYIVDELISCAEEDATIYILMKLVDLAELALKYDVLYEDYYLGTSDIILNIPQLSAFHAVTNTILANYHKLKELSDTDRPKYPDTVNALLELPADQVQTSDQLKPIECKDYRALMLEEFSK